MNEKNVSVVSLTSGLVVLSLPQYHYSRTWPKKGSRIMIDREILSTSMYMTGVERLFTEGNLYIEDEAFRIELGLETEAIPGEDIPAKTLILLDDKLLNRLIKMMPVNEVEEIVKKLSPTQKNEVTDYAVSHYQDLKMDRVDLLSKLCETNILKAVEMKKTWRYKPMTSYSVAYDAFLARILEDEWEDWTLAEAEQDWRQILESALPWFKFPRVSLEHNDTGFVEDLGNEEIQIIANYMKCEWLNRCIMTWENVKPLYEERDFSQANLLDKLQSMIINEREKAHALESIYYRSRKGKPFNFSSLAGGDN